MTAFAIPPGGAADWPCPYGKPWSDSPAPASRADVEAAAAKTSRTVPEHVSRRLKTCGVGEHPSKWCEELSDNASYCEKIITRDCKTCHRAGKFNAFIADMNSRCPLRKW